jgi:hypothetical protein
VALNTINHHYHCFFLQISRHAKRKSQLEQINEMPLYPTEEIIWDENIVPTDFYSGDGLLCLLFSVVYIFNNGFNSVKDNNVHGRVRTTDTNPRGWIVLPICQFCCTYDKKKLVH